jgi:uncharacterized membrane protein YphA (DoxX/SURF4 family)
MAKIQIEEPQPASIVATHTLLRDALGGIVLLEVGRRALHYGAWQERIAQLGLGHAGFDAALLARSLLVLGVLVGVCLVAGLLTRLVALGVIAVAIFVLSTLQVRTGLPFEPRFELACLLIASAAYLFASGASAFSVDTVLRRRARRRAIERDPIWNSAPYAALLLGLLCTQTSACTNSALPPAASAESEPLAADMDPAVGWPNIHRVVLENEYVRVIDTRLPAGQHDGWHRLPVSAEYTMSAADLRVHTRRATHDVSVPAGLASINDDDESHWTENVGRGAFHELVVERKGSPPQLASDPYYDPARVSPGDHTVVAEGQALRVLEIRTPAGASSVEHSHRAAVLCAVEPAELRHNLPDGTTTSEKLAAGQVMYLPAVARESVTNLGAKPLYLVMVELQ